MASKLYQAMRGEKVESERGERRNGASNPQRCRSVDSKEPRDHVSKVAAFHRDQKLGEGKQSPGPGREGSG